MSNSKNTDIPRATGLIIVEVRDSNPNGDPERDGAPRRRRGDIGEISPVSVKRKMRDLIGNKKGPIWLYLKNKFNIEDESHFEILEERERDRNAIAKMIKADDSKPIEQKEFVRRYWDGRVFGNTFLEEAKGDSGDDKPEVAAENGTKKAKSKKKDEAFALKKNVKTGVMHFGLGLSVAPITVRTDFTLTNKPGVQEGKTAGMAPGAFKFVEHGIYAIPFFINPTQASETGCTKKDVDVAIEIIPYVYSHNRSLVRTQVEVLHAWYAEHKNQKGSFNDFDLIDVLKPRKRKKEDESVISQSEREYDIPNPITAPEVIKAFEGKLTIRDLMDLMRP